MLNLNESNLEKAIMKEKEIIRLSRQILSQKSQKSKRQQKSLKKLVK